MKDRLCLGSFECQIRVICDADAFKITTTGTILRNVFNIQEIDDFYRKKSNLLVK